nr:MAG TPA: hypothetical protein [Bacteriophage sp.]DAV71182.1 MAG TPA: hypothetical protein [Bacteriophage sp.]
MANGLRNNSIPPYRKSCAKKHRTFLFPHQLGGVSSGVKELKELSLPSVAEELRQ